MANSKKILIVVFLVAAVCAAYLFFFLLPKNDEIKQLEDTLSKRQDELAEKQRIAKDLDMFNRQVVELNERLQESLKQLPEDKEIAEILRLLSRLAGISGIEMTNFTVGAEVPKSMYSEVPIELQLIGGFHNIAIFFDKIGKQERIINISNVKVAQPKMVNGETVVTTTCTATAFRFMAQPPPPPPGDAKKAPEPKAEEAPKPGAKKPGAK